MTWFFAFMTGAADRIADSGRGGRLSGRLMRDLIDWPALRNLGAAAGISGAVAGPGTNYWNSNFRNGAEA